jgi:hypothetical protein
LDGVPGRANISNGSNFGPYNTRKFETTKLLDPWFRDSDRDRDKDRDRDRNRDRDRDRISILGIGIEIAPSFIGP